MNKSELKPALVFEQFAKINEIPRPSKYNMFGISSTTTIATN